MKDTLKNKFSAFGKSGMGTPSELWKKEFRGTLMMQIKNTVANEPQALPLAESVLQFARFLFPREQLQFASRAISVILLACGLVFGGSITTVSAALNSIPGDFLYTLKLITEDAQVRLAGSDEAKVELHVEFAGRRVAEVAKINEDSASGNGERTAAAVLGFKEQMQTVNEYMEDLSTDPEKVSQVAKLVDAKNEVHQQILDDVRQKLPDSDVRGFVNEARAVAEDTGVRAVEVLVVTHSSASSTVTAEEIKDKVESKISDMEKKVSELSGIGGIAATSTPSAAKEVQTAITEAKEFSSAGDFASALTKIREGNEIVRAVAAATVTSISASNSSTPAILNPNVEAQGYGEVPTGTVYQAQTFDEGLRMDENSTTPRIIQP